MCTLCALVLSLSLSTMVVVLSMSLMTLVPLVCTIFYSSVCAVCTCVYVYLGDIATIQHRSSSLHAKLQCCQTIITWSCVGYNENSFINSSVCAFQKAKIRHDEHTHSLSLSSSLFSHMSFSPCISRSSTGALIQCRHTRVRTLNLHTETQSGYFHYQNALISFAVFIHHALHTFWNRPQIPSEFITKTNLKYDHRHNN